MTPEPPHILILEDEPEVARATERALSRIGYAVTTVADGADGLAAAVSGNYDLCLLNVILPGMGGYAIAERLHADGVSIPLIFCTDKPQHEVSARIQALGIKAAYLQKPLSTRGLAQKIGEVLDGRGWL